MFDGRDGKRTTTALLAGVLLSGVTVTVGPSAPVRAQPGGPSSDSGPVTLVTGADLSFGGIRRQLVEYWNRRPGNRTRQIRIVELASVADLQRAQLLAAGQSGDTGYDVLNLDLTWTAEFAENGAIRPLDDGMLSAAGPNDFFERPLESARYRKQGSDRTQLWAVPFNTDVGLLYYRKDLLATAGRRPPTSWQDMVDAQRAVHDHQVEVLGDSPLRAAYTAQLGRYEGLTVNAVEATAAAGEDLARLPEASKGLLELADRVRTGSILPESTTFDESGSLQAFRDGTALFMRNWPYAYNVLAADPALPPGDIGVARLPWPGALGGQNLAISAHSTKSELAREVIEFLTSPSSEQCLLERGGLAATRRAVYDPASRPRCFLDPSPAEGPSERADTLYTSSDALPALVESLDRAVLRPVTPYYSQVTDVIQARVTELLTTTADHREIVEGLPGELTAALTGR